MVSGKTEKSKGGKSEKRGIPLKREAQMNALILISSCYEKTKKGQTLKLNCLSWNKRINVTQQGTIDSFWKHEYISVSIQKKIVQTYP